MEPVTAFIVRVPEAEPLVGDLRARYDRTSELGVPSHITVLFPFMPPQAITADVLARAARAFGDVPPFDFALREVGRWPETAYLAPEPAEPFIALTRAIVQTFPDFQPYGGRHAAIVPHLTVADGSAEAASTAEVVLRAAMLTRGPVDARCAAVELIGNASTQWRTMHVIPLGGGSGTRGTATGPLFGE